MPDHYVYIAPHSKHVNLGFYHGAADVGREEVRNLIAAAIQECRKATGLD